MRPEAAIFCIIFCFTFFCACLKFMVKDIWDREEVLVLQKGLLLGGFQHCLESAA